MRSITNNDCSVPSGSTTHPSSTNALGQATHQHFDPEGRPLATWGATYPVAYAYDAHGRMSATYTLRDSAVALTNYASFQFQVSSFDKTTWQYDLATGLLTNKLYADTNGTAYAYTPDGKLETRTWARGIVTTYRYDEATGAMTNIAYGGSAPDVTFVLDRLGRQTSITDGTGTRTFTYNDSLQLAAETNVMGSVNWQYDSLGRGIGYTLGAGSLVGYAFDHVGRLATVTSFVDSATIGTAYSFLPNADLIAGWSNNVGFAVARSFESNRNLLLSVSNGFGGSVTALFDYQNDVLGRRTARIDDRAVTNVFAYDALSQLTNAIMGANGFGYQYDPIGNRLTATSNAVTHLYTANTLNQYTAITHGGPRTLAYDIDGNLTNDTVFAYSWDGENRLIQVSNFQFQVSFAYDYMSRRYRKIVGGVTNTFLYDGWNLIQEVSASAGGVVTNVYTWGPDLSGSLQGAGGIGGLLAVTRAGVTYFPCYDANGNITDYVTTNGTVVAHREYDAFGNTVIATGPLVHDLHHWFSSKYLDEETGLYYYGYRYYSPELGRWLNRDPIGEEAFLRAYLRGKQPRERRELYQAALSPPYPYMHNNVLQSVDPLGLRPRWAFPCTNRKACELAREEGADGGSFGRVICSRERHIPCVWMDNVRSHYDGDPGPVIDSNVALALIEQCILKHEQTHIDNGDATPCPSGAFPLNCVWCGPRVQLSG